MEFFRTGQSGDHQGLYCAPRYVRWTSVKLLIWPVAFAILGGLLRFVVSWDEATKAIPSVKTALELLNPPLYRLSTPELEDELRDAIAKMKDKPEGSLTYICSLAYLMIRGLPSWEIFSRFAPILKVQIDDHGLGYPLA